MPPWNPVKTKVQLRLAVQRLRILQEKKEAQAKSARRDIATLIEGRKLEKARVKVENIINEDIYVELLELLELYCELIIARFGLLDQNAREPDPGISEAVCAVVHAAPRTELKELHILREILMHKYGREFAVAVMENTDGCVSERITSKVTYGTPPASLVDAYLSEIARGYNIDWQPDGKSGDDDSSDGGGLKEPVSPVTLKSLEPPLKAGTPVLPDIPPTEDATEPSSQGTAAKSSDATASKPTAKAPEKKPQEDEFTALMKRFEALKRR